jgi:DNA-binding transcriptional MerR regulator
LEAHLVAGGCRGYCEADIQQPVVIRRLVGGLDLDLSTVGVVLHLRRRTFDLLDQIEQMEQRMLCREQELIAEINAMQRRISEDGEWEF